MKKNNSPTINKKELKIHIRISAEGEICAWGLEQEDEKQLLDLTGNQDLSNKNKAMSFSLCG